jgi:diguanylate cyclase (GGDEF)-like protein/PAS domain S-box-containing protein
LENVIGYSVEEFQNIDWFQISDPGELSEELKLEAQLFNRDIPNYSFDKSYIRKDGRKIYITVRKSIYWSEDNKPQYIIISFEDITAKTKFYKKIEYMSYHDELTGLYNRAFFENQVNDFEQTNKTNISIIMGDVNNLKLTNDIFGHYQGDKLLQIMADILTRVIGNHGIICRWAGDEFAAILPNTSESETQLLIQNILDECLLYQEEHESLMTKTDISLGYATKSSLTDTLYDVFSRAEQMMYRQKIIDSKRINYFSLESLEQTLVEKSKETTQHLDRLSHLAKRFGHYLNLSKDNIEKLELVAKIHDIGKIAIDNSVLNKPTSLSPQEWIEIKRHPEIGYRIARTNPNLIHVSDLILSHHERVDGRGYPRGLKSDQIPYLSKILLIMDAYDAMRYDRVYRDAMTMKEIIHELESNAGTQFDQKLVHKFIQFIQK